MRLFKTLAFTACFLAHAAYATPEVGKPAPDFTAKDIEGRTVTLSALKGKNVVLEWNNPGCPFVQKFYGEGEMQRLQKQATAKDTVWLTINSSAAGKQGNITVDEAKKFVADQKATPTHYIQDADGKIGTLYGAKTTPHMFVVDSKGTLAYAGAIDSIASADKADIAKAKNYVTTALDELKAGKPVTTATTQAYGCSVKYAE